MHGLSLGMSKRLQLVLCDACQFNTTIVSTHVTGSTHPLVNLSPVVLHVCYLYIQKCWHQNIFVAHRFYKILKINFILQNCLTGIFSDFQCKETLSTGEELKKKTHFMLKIQTFL